MEVLLGLLGKAIDHSFQCTRLVLEILPGECLRGRREFARAAATRLIMQAFRSVLFPFVDPSRHGDTMDLIGLSNVLAHSAIDYERGSALGMRDRLASFCRGVHVALRSEAVYIS